MDPEIAALALDAPYSDLWAIARETLEAFERALQVQRRLAHVGGLHHRSVKIADLIIASSAEAAGATVLHYDADFDRIAESEVLFPPTPEGGNPYRRTGTADGVLASHTP
jgi:predicted nucleic acid-binding protein